MSAVDGLMAGLELPDYTLVRRIGEGGMAYVYLAVQKSLQREIALKVLNPMLADSPSFTKRFVNEGRVLAALRHTHIVTIHDIGAARGWHYIAMELLEGGDLKRRIDQGLDRGAALATAQTIALALQHAHERGVVHRDVKPANILYRGDGSLVLSDFGIAKQLEGGAERTLTRVAVGSPHYLSPEQAQARPVDARADVYSLGIVIYEMLTGSLPFRGGSEIDTVLKHLTEPVPQLPRELAAFQPLLQGMLAKDPDDRFQTMDEVLARLAALRAGLGAGAADAPGPGGGTVTWPLPEPGTAPGRDPGREPGRDPGRDPDPASLTLQLEPLGEPGALRRRLASLLPGVSGRSLLLGGGSAAVLLAVLAGLALRETEPAAQPASLPAPASAVADQASPPGSDQAPGGGDVDPQASAASSAPDATLRPAPAIAAAGTGTGSASALVVASSRDAAGGNPPAAEPRGSLQGSPQPTSPDPPSSAELPALDAGRGFEPSGSAAPPGSFGSPGPPAAVVSPRGGVDAAPSDPARSQVQALLASADSAIEDFRLTSPAGHNAVHYIERILEIEPGNAAARAAFDRVADRYAVLARMRLDEGSTDRARLYVQRGLSVDEAHPELLALQARLGAVAPASPATTPAARAKPPDAGGAAEEDAVGNVFGRIKGFLRQLQEDHRRAGESGTKPEPFPESAGDSM